MKKNDSDENWSVTFEPVEEVQLKDMLKATPAQRLAMAEELFKFTIEAKSAKIIKIISALHVN